MVYVVVLQDESKGKVSEANTPFRYSNVSHEEKNEKELQRLSNYVRSLLYIIRTIRKS